MKRSKLSILPFLAAALIVPAVLANSAGAQAPAGRPPDPDVTEALTTDMNQLTDDLWNELGTKGSPPDECGNDPVPNRSFEDNKFIFRERETAEEGLGPIYNGVSCDECHQNPDTGGFAQQREVRAGNFSNGVFTQASGGNVIHMRSTVADVQEHLEDSTVPINVVTFRAAISLLGDGFVEAIPDERFTEIRNAQPPGFEGTIIQVPILEAPGKTRVGRFGWKSQEGSLLSFTTNGYLNELGITTPRAPNDNTSMGRSVAEFDPVSEIEDDGADAEAFANFIRATRAPGRGPITHEAEKGERIFERIGCANCHVPSIVTGAEGALINGDTFSIPAALANKRIHPYSDFLLHDLGTGDGLVQQGGVGTRNQMRTAPLWGLRARNVFMHDGQSTTLEGAILRHAGQAGSVQSRDAFISLNSNRQADLIAFLRSL